MNRRAVIAMLSGAAAVPALLRPRAARAQQRAVPVVGYLDIRDQSPFLAAFIRGLAETGFVAGRNVAIELRLAAGGEYHRFPELITDLARRNVALIATGFTPAALAAKSATATIPIVFSTASDPVKVGLVASLARPGGNVTGVSFFSAELA